MASQYSDMLRPRGDERRPHTCLPEAAASLPCGERISDICPRVDPCGMAKSLEKAVSANLERLQSLGLLAGKRADVAVDMHLIRRRDRKHEAEPVRSKSKGKTGSFGRHIAAQRARPGMQMALALLHVPALEDTACYVRKTAAMCRRTGTVRR